MNKYLSIDIGSTCCKCQLFDKNGHILEYISQEYDFFYNDNQRYVNIEKIKEIVFDMISTIAKKHPISSISFSTIGESFVLLDNDDNILFNPMIYSDFRGVEQAKYIESKFDNQYLIKTTGTLPHAMFSISKLLYIKQEYPDIYKKAKKVMLLLDYLGYIFTGKRVIDYSLASRTGIFNINTLEFDKDMCDKLRVDINMFSSPKKAGFDLGFISETIKKQLGINYDIKVILGSHDQLCNMLGSGIIRPGGATDGMGTVECVALVFTKNANFNRLGLLGLPIVPFLGNDNYCTYFVNYASNSITNWYKNEIAHNYQADNDNFFAYMEQKIDDNINDIYVLPYFSGCVVPYNDVNAKGVIINLTTTTKDFELYKSILEGMTMEMYLELDIGKKCGIKIKNIIATGGGSLSKKRLQMKADMQNVKVSTLKSQEGGLCGLAVIQACALKDYDGLEETIKHFVKIKDVYKPNREKHKLLMKKYKKFIKIYKHVKELY